MTNRFRRTVESFYALALDKSQALTDGQLVTQAVTVGYVDAHLAVDGDGLPHLLVPVHGTVSQDRRSAAVWITRRELQVDGELQVFADLGCRDHDLVRVFDRLVTEVLEVAERTGERLDLVQARTLVEWRHLLSAARGRLSHEIVTGLFGELSVLCHLAEAEPHLALDAWVGPTGATQDFQHGNRAIEVKSRVTHSAERVRISSLEQLDWRTLDKLTLAVIDVEDDDFGQSLGDLVDRAVAIGVPRLALNDLLEGFGFVAGMKGDEERRMQVARLRVWQVAEGFPALTTQDMDPSSMDAVVSVNYSLDITRLPDPVVDDWKVLVTAVGWAE